MPVLLFVSGLGGTILPSANPKEELDFRPRSGKTAVDMRSRFPNHFRPRGLSTLEILVILLVVVGAIFGGKIATEKWKRGSERSQCILNIRNAQTAGRSYQGMNSLGPGADLDWTMLVGPGIFLGTKPVCPGGGTYRPKISHPSYS
jgi:hypothetical protein